MSTRKRVVSGMRPTGRLHLGHLVGALQNWVELQRQYDCFYFVADWHALTSEYAATEGLVENAIDNVADWIAAGIDPEQSTLFVQSMVPDHAELYLLFQMVTPIPWLERVPTYKEQMEQLAERDLSNLGFLGYPLLQTADVVIYDAHFVPVGEDQVPHLELSREVVRRFHNFYGEVFVEPQPLLTPTPRLPGLDNRKMSKSYNNTIDLSDSAEDITKKIRQMYTDPKRVRADIPGTVEGNPVFIYHDAFNPNTEEVDDLKERYRIGELRLHLHVANLASTIALFQIVDFLCVRIERVVIDEHRVPLHGARNVRADAFRIGVHRHHLFLHVGGAVREVNRVADALAHLLAAVEARQAIEIREQRLRFDENFAEEVVEAAHHLTRELEMRHLVRADRDEARVVHGNVRRLQQRISEEPDRRQILVFQVLLLLLV